MAKSIFAYLSGSIQKGSDDRRGSFWTVESIAVLRDRILPVECIILNPSERGDDLSDAVGTLGRDLCQVACSDVVVVDARERRGLGVGAEMYLAKARKIPVISIVPPNSHYHRHDVCVLGQDVREWVHPFIWGLSDVVVGDIAEAADAIVRVTTSNDVPIRDVGYCYDAIRHYLNVQLYRDGYMRELVAGNEEFRRRTDTLLHAQND